MKICYNNTLLKDKIKKKDVKNGKKRSIEGV